MSYLSQIVGQESVKSRLEIYTNSFVKTGQLPFLLFKAAKGSGKTKVIREFRKTLIHPNGNGQAIPILEVNCATIKDPEAFFNTIYPMWTNHGAFLFLDECHNLPIKIQEIFLTVLEKDPNPVRRITFNHKDNGEVDYEFDFTRISIGFATTDHQKVLAPLLDRLSGITLAEYSKDELMTIFKKNVNVKVSDHILQEITNVFRGNARYCVKLAEELDCYAKSKGLSYVNIDNWKDFCKVMGIFNGGLDDAEILILKVLGSCGACSLQALSAKTGFSRAVIQKEYELALLNKGLLEIDGKRMLTAQGNKYFLEHLV